MDPRALTLYNDYIHGDMPRRDFLRRLAGIVGGAAAASALLPLIEPNFAQAQQVAPDDPQLDAGYVEYPGRSGAVRGYLARPADRAGALPGVVVIHENRGLNAHIEDVARRAALAGYVALAPDGLSVAGGAPENQDEARDLFAATERSIIDADVMLAVTYLAGRDDCAGRIGTVGFCYGGGVALRCAVEQPATFAAVCFYGQALSAEQVARVRAPLTLHYAGEDERINAGIADFRRALDEHHVAYSLHMYPGTGHGFHNDASAGRYNAAAARLAWSRTIAFFDARLKV